MAIKIISARRLVLGLFLLQFAGELTGTELLTSVPQRIVHFVSMLPF